MDPSSARSQLQHDLLKHSSIGEQRLESNRDRLLDDSKLQHSNNISSSEAASPTLRHGLFYYSQNHQSVVKPNTITSKEKIVQAEQRQNYKAHKQGLIESKSASKVKVMKPYSHSVSYSKGVDDDEYHTEEASSPSDPDYFSLADKYNHNRHEIISGSHHHSKHGKVHANDVSKKTISNTSSARHKESESDSTKIRTQSMTIVCEASNVPRVQGKWSSLSLPGSPLNVAAVGGQLNVAHVGRHPFGDFRNSSNQSSQHSLAHNDDFNSEKTRSNFTNHHATSSSLLQYESEISTNLFSKYKTDSSKVECSSYQGNASMPLSLHLSLSDISSESHVRMTKSTRDLRARAVRLSFEHLFEPENVKSKVKSVWNNIRFGWTFKSKSSFKYDSPLFMLGKCYHRRKDDPGTEPEDQFLRDFVSRIWLTYRSNFYPIPGTKLNTDCGWGCMLRSGQMLIAQCLVTHFLGRDWRLYNKQTDTESVFYREIIRWFSDPLDVPSDKTPFCLHNLTNFGRAYNKDPGNWYGPASVAYIFRDTFIKASHTVPILSQLCLYVAQDCTVYIEDVNNLCLKRHRSGSLGSSSECDVEPSRLSQKTQNEKWLRSVIILIPMRLGGEVTNEIYAPCVQSLLSHDNCMGIIGGRPKHSLYFLGWQDSKLIYLDPHLCREAVDTTVPDFKIETFHCMTPRKLAIRKMDPSCAVGFYIKDADDFKHFVQEVKEFIAPPKQKGIYPLFTFSNGRQSESTFSQTPSAKDKRVRVTHYYIDQYGHKTISGESEEFVML